MSKIYNDLWKNDPKDVFVKNYPLQGEGQWFESYVYLDEKGSTYEVWVDQDGDSKIL